MLVLSVTLLLELPLCGKGWGFVGQPSATDTDLQDLWMHDANVGWAVGKYDTVLRTTNGWATSTFIMTSLGQTSGIGMIVYDWHGVSFQNEMHGWIVGSNGMALYSTDGGVSFESQVRGGATLHAVSCFRLWTARAACGCIRGAPAYNTLHLPWLLNARAVRFKRERRDIKHTGPPG
jgi:hypothetical protein